MGQAATNIDFARGLYLGPKVAVVHQNIDFFFFYCRSPPKNFLISMCVQLSIRQSFGLLPFHWIVLIFNLHLSLLRLCS